MTRLAHRRLRQQIDAYLDGELDGARARTIAAHLQDCWDCNDAAHDLRLIRASLARLRRDGPASLTLARLKRWAGGIGQ